MKSPKDILFHLIRCVFQDRADYINLSDCCFADWSEVVDLAFEQGVAAIAVDGLQRRLGVSGERLEVRA